MAWTLLLGFVALTLVFVWMLLVRYRIGVLEDWLGSSELDVALRERQAEGMASDRGEDRLRRRSRSPWAPPMPPPRWRLDADERTGLVDPTARRSRRCPMNYVIAGYTIVLGLLFLYAVQLVWRRRRLTRTVDPASGRCVQRRADRAGRGRAVTSGPPGRAGTPAGAARPGRPGGADTAPVTGSATWSWVWSWSGRWSSCW